MEVPRSFINVRIHNFGAYRIRLFVIYDDDELFITHSSYRRLSRAARIVYQIIIRLVLCTRTITVHILIRIADRIFSRKTYKLRR